MSTHTPTKQQAQPKSYMQQKLEATDQAIDAASLDLEYHSAMKNGHQSGYVISLKWQDKQRITNKRACYLFHCKRISELKNLICRLSGQISSLTKNV